MGIVSDWGSNEMISISSMGNEIVSGSSMTKGNVSCWGCVGKGAYSNRNITSGSSFDI